MSVTPTKVTTHHDRNKTQTQNNKMAPTLSEDEIDDLVYFARTGENDDLTTLLTSLAEREKVSPAEILSAAKDEGKSTSLHMAAANGHLETVTLLLSHFPNSTSDTKTQRQDFLDAPNEYGNTALHWAALSGHLDVVKKLVDAGASVAIANDKNYVPLDLAALNEKRDVVDYFLAQSGMLEETNAKEGLRAGLEGVEVDGEDFEGGEEGETQGKADGKEKGSSS
ncbi:ankyrin repeat-containing protein YAR1 [Podospora aff. communis PSN243]|uniref:Ankyrin repeat-containing protein YAR1 n=1 Tax=Podospora aff. communis PSN243 TaxID=3040156 RepID=A0AAV9GCD2_9PEZI|nr:ankyrin repeat-containing protein YAR1 [Podospora aff. communis PSN243]